MKLRLTDCEVDLERRTVTRPGQLQRLTAKEAQLLERLASRPDTVVPDQTLLEEVWGYRSTVISRAVDQTLYRLRKKIERDPAHPDHLIKVYGEGIRFVSGVAIEEGAPPAPVRHASLPAWHTAFFGRSEELEALDRLVLPGRVVALTGLGGVGKTRLVVHWVDERCTSNAVFVDAASCESVDEVQTAIGFALEVGPEPTGVDVALSARAPAVVVLDNLRVDVPPVLLAALARKDVALVYLSGRPRDIAGERRLPVSSLDDEAAAALFEDRLPSVAHAHGAASPESSEILKLLGGHPLAIELCSARASVLAQAEMLRRLREPLKLLRSARRGPSLRHALEASWDLLDEPLKQGLRRFSVFGDGVDIEGAEALLGGLEAVEELVAAGFLVFDTPVKVDGATWFSLLDPVRAFVGESVDAGHIDAAVGAMSGRLAGLFAPVGHPERAQHQVCVAYESALIRVLRSDALADERRFRLIVVLGMASFGGGARHEASRAMAAFELARVPVGYEATFLAMRMLLDASEPEREALYSTALTHLRDPVSAEVRFGLVAAMVSNITRLGRLAEAVELASSTLATFDGPNVGLPVRILLWVSLAEKCNLLGDTEQATHAARQAIELCHALGRRRQAPDNALCRALTALGVAQALSGSPADAVVTFEEARDAALANRHRECAVGNLGQALCESGRPDEGLPHLRQVFDDLCARGSVYQAAQVGLAVVAHEHGEARERRLWRLAGLLDSELMAPLRPWYQAELAIHLAHTDLDGARVALQQADVLAERLQLAGGSEARSRIEVARALVSSSAGD